MCTYDYALCILTLSIKYHYMTVRMCHNFLSFLGGGVKNTKYLLFSANCNNAPTVYELIKQTNVETFPISAQNRADSRSSASRESVDRQQEKGPDRGRSRNIAGRGS